MAAMEFSYTISEAEYLQAGRVSKKASGRAVLAAKLIFWFLVLAFLIAGWGLTLSDPHVVTISHGADGYDYATTDWSRSSHPFARASHTLMVNFGPIAIFLMSAAGVYAFRGPVYRLRRAYRKNPVMNGKFTVFVTPESFSGRNSAGTSWQDNWTLFESWREGSGLILLNLRNGPYYILNLAGLSDPQRTELRSILADALPQK
jgi:hypothetical protein